MLGTFLHLLELPEGLFVDTNLRLGQCNIVSVKKTRQGTGRKRLKHLTGPLKLVLKACDLSFWFAEVCLYLHLQALKSSPKACKQATLLLGTQHLIGDSDKGRQQIGRDLTPKGIGCTGEQLHVVLIGLGADGKLFGNGRVRFTQTLVELAQKRQHPIATFAG